MPAASSTPFGRAIRNMAWLLTGKGVGAALSLVYLALATRTLGVAGFGQLALVLGIGQAAAALVSFQTWQIVVRFGMAPLQAGDTPALKRVVRFCLALDWGAALVGCLLASVAILAVRARFGWSGEVAMQAIAFCLVLLLCVRSTAVGVLRLHDRYRLGAACDSVTFVVRFLGALAAVWLEAGVAGFLLAWAVAEVATAIGYWWNAHRLMPGVMGLAGAREAVAENPGLTRFAWQTNVTATLNASGRQFAVVLVGLLTGAAAAGGYRLAHQLAQGLVRVAEMFARGVFPEIARAHAGAAAADLASLRRRSLRLTLAAGGATCIAVPLLGRPALLLIAGPEWLAAYPLLVLLGIAAGLDIVAAGFEPVLLGTGHAGTVLRIRAVAAAVLFAALVPLALWLGALGAGVAVLAATALTLALLAHASARAVRVETGA